MKFPVHISLDVSINSSSPVNRYWIFKYFETFEGPEPVTPFLTSQKKYLVLGDIFLRNKLFSKKKKFTIAHSQYIKFRLSKWEAGVNFLETLLQPSFVKRKAITSSYDSACLETLVFKKKKKIFDKKFIIKFYRLLGFSKKAKSPNDCTLWVLFDINFIRKEKIYTKLKYSRVPQYDVVSGGSAALFAGFLGFLICEKFGFELLDSGDFFYLFMYFCFFCFFCNLFLKIISKESGSWNPLSVKWFLGFYKTFFFLLFNPIKDIFQ